MKKAVLLLMLLPFLGLSQTLVTWNTTGATTPVNTHITAQTIVLGNGVSIENNGWSGFRINNLHDGTSNINYGKYVEFRITPGTGYNAALSQFTFIYNSPSQNGNGANKLQVRYSTDPSFPSNGTLLGSEQTLVHDTDTPLTFAFPANYKVAPNTTLYVRVYPFAAQNNYYTDFYVRNTTYNASVNGPTLTGTTPTSGGVIANDDTAETISTKPVTIDVTHNDTKTNTSISALEINTQPATTNGVVTKSGNNLIFTPVSTFAGTSAFTYKITGADGTTSIATVRVTVTAQVNPTAGNDSATLVKNGNATINVLSNDTVGNGSISSIAVTTPAAHGTTTIQSDNTVLYTPNTGFAGTDSFKYTLTNSYGYTATATVSLVVNVPAVGTAPLAGTYVISGTTQYVYPQFTTITAAVNHLNTYGISGAVTFLLKDTSYTNTTETFPFTINAIANSSSANTVTFKPYSGITTSIEATNVTAWTGIPAIFYLNGADYITFDGSNATNGTTRNLTIINSDGIDSMEHSVIWVASNGSDGATHITVKNCNLKQTKKNQGGKFSVGVYSGSNGLGQNSTMNVAAAGANNSYLTITNNDFMNVKQGVYINGGSVLTTNVLVNKNDLGSVDNTETIISPATFSNVSVFEYSDNLINNLYRDSDNGNLVSAGIYVTGASKSGSILRNNMRDLTRTVTNNQVFGGIVLSSTDYNSNILIANNFILNVTGAGSGGGYLNGYGIVADNGGGYKIYYNTVSLNTPQPGGGFSSAFYVSGNARNLDVRNNIFANNQPSTTGTRRTAITVVNTVSNINTIFTNLDYNDYFSNDRIAYIANVNDLGKVDWPGNGIAGDYGDNADYFYTLSAFRNVTHTDAKSLNINPAFNSASDLHINAYSAANANLNNAGTTALSSVITKDIDGQLRSTTAPDMGADEFGAVTMPAAGDNSGIYCDSATTWNGTAWSNGTPDATKDAIFNGTFTQAGGTFYACSIFVLNGASVNFISDATAVVTHSVNIDSSGALTFESSSNLIQVENDANSGIATVKRNSSNLKRLDYSMWTAPVFDARATGFQTLYSFSPLTTSNRYYEYATKTSLYMPLDAPTTKFALGKGYLIRMPNGGSLNYNGGFERMIFNGEFKGTPNNGIIKVGLQYADVNNAYNAVGNPYPSPINVTDFINDNINVIEGTIWLWRKTNNENNTSYCTVNLAGYVANKAPGGGGVGGDDGNTLIADPYSIDPKGSLNTAQGFIVKAKAANKEIVFKNNMRIQTHAKTFFRSANTESIATEPAAQTDRVWFNITNATGDFAQALVAYNPLTTTGYDNGYDGASLSGGSIDLYSVLKTQTDTLNLSIQSRGTFAESDVVPMGFTTTTAGTYAFSIDHTDGLFAQDQKVLLVDTKTGLTKDLKEGSYSFDAEIGTFNDRFKVIYTTTAVDNNDGDLGTDTPVVQAKQLIAYKDGKQVKIQAPSDINTVVVYDMLGKVLFQKTNIDGESFATSEINTAQQVIILQITLDNQQVVTKKIMMN